eukprot:m.103304 g.103304  ORF g.103304 m.103304 type:complete len:573 (+) comp27489_c0_seq1:216-1934(+)
MLVDMSLVQLPGCSAFVVVVVSLIFTPGACDGKTTCFSEELRTHAFAPIGCAPYAVYDIDCPTCGDGSCDIPGESTTNCPADCLSPEANQNRPAGDTCGDDVCDPASKEDCESCPVDCGACVFSGPYKLCSVQGSRKMMALTFDDGPSNTTVQVLNLLQRYNAKATFFNVATETDDKITNLVLHEGHDVAGHTFNHTALANSVDVVRDDTTKAEARIKTVIGNRTRYMRPPYGRLNFAAQHALDKLGYKIILWSGGAWPETLENVMQSLNNMFRQSANGIFMFHGEQQQHENMVVLEAILKRAKELDVELVPLHVCLGDAHSKGFKSRNGVCVDDECRCSSTTTELPRDARKRCFKGDLSFVVDRSVQTYDGQSTSWDHCLHSNSSLRPKVYKHWWYGDGLGKVEANNAVLRSIDDHTEKLANLETQLRDSELRKRQTSVDDGAAEVGLNVREQIALNDRVFSEELNAAAFAMHKSDVSHCIKHAGHVSETWKKRFQLAYDLHKRELDKTKAELTFARSQITLLETTIKEQRSFIVYACSVVGLIVVVIMFALDGNRVIRKVFRRCTSVVVV